MNNSLEKVDMRAKFIVLDDLFVNEVDMYKDTDTICDFKCLTCNDVYKSSINKIVYFYEHKGKPYTEVCACGKSNSNNEIKYEDVIQGYEDLFKEFKLSGKKTTMYASTCINCGSKFMASSNTIRRRGKLLCYECSKKGNFDAKSSNNYKSLSELVKGIEDYWSDENILKPNEIKIRYSSREKFKTICPYCNKIIEKRYDAILRSGPYCGPCAKRVNVDIDDSLEYMYPFTAKKYDESEKNKLPSNSIHANSHEKYWFHCDICNQDFEKSLSVMVRAEKEGVSGCPVCRGFKVVEGVNDLLSKNVYGSMYWDYDKNTISPKMVRYSSDNKYWFKCLQGHSFKMSPRKLLRAYNENSDGCPVCSGRRLVKGVNDVATVYKGDLSRWSKNSLIQPDEVTMGSNKIITVLCANCGKEFNTSVYNYTHDSVCFCDNCRNHNYSKAEKDIVKYIRSLGFNVEENVDIGGHKSVDILIREKGIAFDYNGLYWHSTEVRPNKNYHLNRIGYVKDVLNARLYYIWEDDYKLKPYIIKNWVKSKLGVNEDRKVNARECIIKLVKSSDASRFLDRYHIQGNAPLSNNIGLYYKDELVAIMSYLIEDNSVLNIKRYCSSCNVRGGFTKLLSYFKKLNYIDYAYTFSDNSISDGELYINNGFILNDEVKPDYSYIVGNKRVHKFSFRKGDFKNRTDLLYQDDLTESQLAVINGLYRVYDSGKKKWVCYF